MPQAIPLGLYVHIPWCVRKCPYCDFNSHAVGDGPIPEQAYVDALLRDLELELPLVWGRRVQSLFLGGGTPSLFSAEALARLLSGIRARLPLVSDCEITLEANPGTVEQARFADYRALGINRLSLGIQSFDDALLQRLGRIHDGAEARRAIDAALAAGFDNFNLDLMFGLPGQDPEAGLADLRTALSYAPPHLSWYQLTLEPNTLFHARPPRLPDEEAVDRLYRAGLALLAEHGLHQYEVSAHARPGHACRHNRNYWEYGDYLGIGAGAHGKLSLPDERILRRARQRQPKRYLRDAGSAAAITSEQTVSPAERRFEFMLNALRLRGGFDLALFRARTGLEDGALEPELGELLEEGLLSKTGTRIRPSERGWRFLDELTARFLPE